MITVIDAQDILFRRLLDMPDLPELIYPNAKSTAKLPRLALRRGPTTANPADLDARVEGFVEILALAESAVETYDEWNASLVRHIIRWFPLGLRLENTVTVKTVPDPRPPFNSEPGVYATPVYIRGHL